MPDLKCPCGHPVNLYRDNFGCGHKVDKGRVAVYCKCGLTQAEAMRAAQRKAAIEKLKWLGTEVYRLYRTNQPTAAYRLEQYIRGYVGALIIAGILGRERGSEKHA